jgi:hypothetical protein
MIDHNKFKQQIIMHTNKPGQTGTQILIQTDTHHKGFKTGIQQYKKVCLH